MTDASETKKDREVVWFSVGALFVVAFMLVTWSLLIWRLPTWSARGTFGDMFGGTNALFSGLAFVGVIYAIVLQSKELELQRKDLKLTRKELAQTAEAQGAVAYFQHEEFRRLRLVKLAEAISAVTELARAPSFNRPFPEVIPEGGKAPLEVYCAFWRSHGGDLMATLGPDETHVTRVKQLFEAASGALRTRKYEPMEKFWGFNGDPRETFASLCVELGAAMDSEAKKGHAISQRLGEVLAEERDGEA